ncbi:hypothetical protein HK098_007682 [Nowakowskiella sp. JEL0407]|nr:hypothetical protein HK098_007682 [Nowakowskiella sp. JEL0407]
MSLELLIKLVQRGMRFQFPSTPSLLAIALAANPVPVVILASSDPITAVDMVPLIDLVTVNVVTLPTTRPATPMVVDVPIPLIDIDPTPVAAPIPVAPVPITPTTLPDFPMTITGPATVKFLPVPVSLDFSDLVYYGHGGQGLVFGVKSTGQRYGIKMIAKNGYYAPEFVCFDFLCRFTCGYPGFVRYLNAFEDARFYFNLMDAVETDWFGLWGIFGDMLPPGLPRSQYAGIPTRRTNLAAMMDSLKVFFGSRNWELRFNGNPTRRPCGVPKDFRKSVFRQIAESLRSLHAVHSAHMDLKLENIVLDLNLQEFMVEKMLEMFGGT